MRPGVPGRNVERLKVPVALAAFFAAGGFGHVVEGLEERYGADEPTEEVYDGGISEEVEEVSGVDIQGVVDLAVRYANSDSQASDELSSDPELAAQELQNYLNVVSELPENAGEYTVYLNAWTNEEYVYTIESPSGISCGEVYYDVDNQQYTFGLAQDINNKVASLAGGIINPVSVMSKSDLAAVVKDALALEDWVNRKDMAFFGIPSSLHAQQLKYVLGKNQFLKG